MVGCVILNYNTWNETINCILSIKRTYKKEIHFYIIDNLSTVDQPLSFKNFILNDVDITFIQAKDNRGYAAGNNIGIKKALEDKCEYILICNSDIEYMDDSLERMIEFLETNLNSGLVGPQIYNRDNMLQPIYMLKKLDFTGKIKNMMLKIPVLKRLFKKFELSFIRREEVNEPLKVFGVSGCSFLMRGTCASYLYPLDEETFLYEEEYIIGSRLEYTPYEVYIVPKTKVVHDHGISTGGMTPFSYKCLVNSEQYYLKKYLKCNRLQCFILYSIRSIIYMIKCFYSSEYRVFFRKYLSSTRLKNK